MANVKTKKNDADVDRFLASVADEKKRADSRVVLELMKEVTGEEPKMWGSSIIGFGSYHYKYESGREGDWFLTGFSPRVQSLTLYIMPGFSQYEGLMARLGKYKTGKSCLYIKRLGDVDLAVLKDLVQKSADYIDQKYNS